MAACGSAPRVSAPAEVAMNRPQVPGATAPLTDGTAAERPRGNAAIARDFLDLEFRMESGRALPVFTRFDGPISVALRGTVPGSAPTDLARLIQRLRTEAGIEIRATEAPANITVEFLPRRLIHGVHANVACFVAPRVRSWAEYNAARGTRTLDWASLTSRDTVAIFVPSDSSPQEVRDCLHEEIAQALGPLNDLYHLPDSVFNDDNFHVVLTDFDMLALRLHYAPELHNGMTRPEVAAALPGLLERHNPGGAADLGPDPGRTPQAWISAMETALGPKGGSGRAQAAERALSIARGQGWQDTRLAFSWFAVGRLNVTRDPEVAAAAFAQAARIYRNLHGAQIHAAHVDMQLAALALARGDSASALSLADSAIPVARRAENASLLATLLMVRAEALDHLGRADEARAVRLDSLVWARYGFGADSVVRSRQRDISLLAPTELAGNG